MVGKNGLGLLSFFKSHFLCIFLHFMKNYEICKQQLNVNKCEWNWGLTPIKAHVAESACFSVIGEIEGEQSHSDLQLVKNAHLLLSQQQKNLLVIYRQKKCSSFIIVGKVHSKCEFPSGSHSGTILHFTHRTQITHNIILKHLYCVYCDCTMSIFSLPCTSAVTGWPFRAVCWFTASVDGQGGWTLSLLGFLEQLYTVVAVEFHSPPVSVVGDQQGTELQTALTVRFSRHS